MFAVVCGRIIDWKARDVNDLSLLDARKMDNDQHHERLPAFPMLEI
jgi:hypothetical protein